MLPPAILLTGPTAAGKSDFALELATCWNCEIISVDSALVYRGLDIGTAKPSAAVQAQVPHHLIDIKDPSEQYSAACFRADALQAMQQITASGRIPLLVGGTQLYFRALQHGLAPLPEADAPTRTQLQHALAQRGLAGLHQWLAEVDPATAARVHPHDPQRIMRALEVFLITRLPLSVHLAQAQQQSALPYRTLKLVYCPYQRELLRQRIAERFDAMLAAGFEQEVRILWARGDLSPELPALRSVGYRQMLDYVCGRSDFDRMRERAIIATRQLAKRQLTWLRAEPDAQWIDQPALGRQLVAQWLSA